MRRILIGAVVLGACNSNKPAAPVATAVPVTRTTSAAALAALPELVIANGRLVCLAISGAPCPASNATANWLTDGKYATWELRRPIEIWTPDKIDPEFLGAVGNSDSQYQAVLSVAATRSGFVVLTLPTSRALLYDTKGRYTSSLPMPPVSVTRTRGFSGRIAFFQIIREAGRDSAAEFEVREVDGPGDTLGVSVLKTKLPWLILRDGRPTTPLTLLPTLPSYAFADDSDIVSSNGDRFSFERRSPKGVLRWSLASDVAGPAVTPAELKLLRAKIPAANKAGFVSFDSAAAHTGKHFPAVVGLFVGSDGRVLAAAAPLPSRDSLDFYMLSNSGEPIGRFALPNRTHPLLYAGDSLLVQRSGANAALEMRWLVIKKP